ncbi:MAG: biotin/lipoyl-binding protein [Muribaculum sp.]|uniref:Biotin/lipoyl-binding protein n=1 Tax=Candidatus Merdivivens faecigallinarum TaxID=2840871 RepID=A0A9D9NQP0_9BACT|nr:biotin/lipoyl-binding protein [Candidatus Merdivivens faecigallinarum]
MKEYKFKINGSDYNVVINSVEGTMANVTVNGAAYSVEMEKEAAPAPAPAAQAAPAPAASGKGENVTSPLPGVILDVNVKVGDTVKIGQQVALLEAMKMENAIESPCNGTVTAVCVSKGDSVLEGATIVVIG